MRIKNGRKGIIATIAAMATLWGVSGAAQDLDFPYRDAASVGMVVFDLKNREYVIEENKEQALLPASTMKAVTVASALRLLGRNFKFTTEVYAIGNAEDSVFNGKIVVKSCGDPTIESSHFSDNGGFGKDIVNALLNKGFKNGKIKIEVVEDMPDSGPIANWLINDYGHGYGAGIFGFNYRDNIFDLNASTMTVSPYYPEAKIYRDASATGSGVAHGINSNIYTIKGSTKGNQRVPMDNPAGVFVASLSSKLKSEGFKVIKSNPAVDTIPLDTIKLLVHNSPRLPAIARSLMVRSDNMMAEGMLRAIAPQRSRNSAIAKELSIWKNEGINVTTINIDDGSGLSRHNRLTPQFLTEMLVSMADSDRSALYIGFFPRVGREGTVKSLLAGTSLAGKLALKSGSMNGVQCYAGYKLDDDDKPTHVVVVMVNGFFCNRATLKKGIERLLLDTFDKSRQSLIPDITEPSALDQDNDSEEYSE